MLIEFCNCLSKVFLEKDHTKNSFLDTILLPYFFNHHYNSLLWLMKLLKIVPLYLPLILE